MLSSARLLPAVLLVSVVTGMSVMATGRTANAGRVGQESSTRRPIDCREWRECRQEALDALAEGEYERFHDLAWRTVQTGPARDPDLMYLLARAQILSGRPHDALVMLDRLAEKGVATDAATNDEFRAVRALRDWPALEARIDALVASGKAPISAGPPNASAPPSALATRSTSASTSPDTSSAAHTSSAAQPTAAGGSLEAAIAPSRPSRLSSRVEDALRVPAAALNSSGLAYDGVSGRFLVADPEDRKIVIIDERTQHVVDLVRSGSAGFFEITALEIDPRRGDLWVASLDRPPSDESGLTAADSGLTPALHKLQLVSGRPLEVFRLPASFGPARFDDVVITGTGTVLALDAIGKRVFRLQPQTHRFDEAISLHLDATTSLAPVDDHTIYVAHAAGIARVDLQSGSAITLRESRRGELAGFERIRWDRSALVGVQRGPDGDHRAERIVLGGDRGDRVRSIEIVEANVPLADPKAATLSGDHFYFLTRHSLENGSGAEIVVRRVRLR